MDLGVFWKKCVEGTCECAVVVCCALRVLDDNMWNGDGPMLLSVLHVFLSPPGDESHTQPWQSCLQLPQEAGTARREDYYPLIMRLKAVLRHLSATGMARKKSRKRTSGTPADRIGKHQEMINAKTPALSGFVRGHWNLAGGEPMIARELRSSTKFASQIGVVCVQGDYFIHHFSVARRVSGLSDKQLITCCQVVYMLTSTKRPNYSVGLQAWSDQSSEPRLITKSHLHDYCCEFLTFRVEFVCYLFFETPLNLSFPCERDILLWTYTSIKLAPSSEAESGEHSPFPLSNPAFKTLPPNAATLSSPPSGLCTLKLCFHCGQAGHVSHGCSNENRKSQGCQQSFSSAWISELQSKINSIRCGAYIGEGVAAGLSSCCR
ncbi:uncharacterized protein VP01_4592g1 [Puccinia sorghi]|uniref:CCHC-type domain-containing protein n=1 Tax=Puccinia sorghi TaxID=27349 RepID=A0A0L6UPC8_9BASI|nr:uncharacterized protein VP01_4592g1 [Puccinia sorghi]